MFSIESVVPGFNDAMAAVPSRLHTARLLQESLDESTLPARIAALIHVSVAQRVGGPYARWALGRLAAHQSIGAEDVFLATVGTARDPVEKTVVAAAGRMASSGRRTHPAEFDALSGLLGQQRATEVVAQVALAMLACEALAAIAPATSANDRREA